MKSIIDFSEKILFLGFKMNELKGLDTIESINLKKKITENSINCFDKIGNKNDLEICKLYQKNQIFIK